MSSTTAELVTPPSSCRCRQRSSPRALNKAHSDRLLSPRNGMPKSIEYTRSVIAAPFHLSRLERPARLQKASTLSVPLGHRVITPQDGVIESLSDTRSGLRHARTVCPMGGRGL